MCYIEYIKTTTQKEKDNLIKWWAKDLYRYFFKDMWMTNKHMKKYSIPLIMREMKIETTEMLLYTH